MPHIRGVLYNNIKTFCAVFTAKLIETTFFASIVISFCVLDCYLENAMQLVQHGTSHLVCIIRFRFPEHVL